MMISKKAQTSHKSKEQSSKITTCSTETNLDESKGYEPESKINSKIAGIQFIFSGVTSLRGEIVRIMKIHVKDSVTPWLVPNPVPATPYVPPTNKELEIVFQPMLMEYLELTLVDNDPFVNVFAPEPSSEASSSGDLSSVESPYVTQILHHLGK
ncbi:hypothetical protein Tco_0101453, partial [Tanacetum coccineum]